MPRRTLSRRSSSTSPTGSATARVCGTRWHGYFAGHGCAGVRVDLRGSGDSEGVLRDEYLEQELADGEAVLAWLAEQPWCNGRVGMIGISWGGFNGLQLAARTARRRCRRSSRSARPTTATPTTCTTWAAACWATTCPGPRTCSPTTACPPDPAIVGRPLARDVDGAPRATAASGSRPGSATSIPRWLLEARLRLRGLHRDQLPRARGQRLGRRLLNAVFRLLTGLQAPCKGLIGPWSHRYPHDGMPGPAIGFLRECLRWWDRWLKDEDNGIDDDPALRAWMQDSIAPVHRVRRASRAAGSPRTAGPATASACTSTPSAPPASCPRARRPARRTVNRGP